MLVGSGGYDADDDDLRNQQPGAGGCMLAVLGIAEISLMRLGGRIRGERLSDYSPRTANLRILKVNSMPAPGEFY